MGDAIQRKAPPDEIQRIFETQLQVLVTHQRSAIGKCPNGHDFGVMLAEPAFSLIYERGLQRLAYGDLRDAVLDVYTALDMYISTVPIRARYDHDPSLTSRDIPRLRNELRFVISDANKALGAALAVVSVVASSAPPSVDTKLQRIRNHAIHAGEYPTVKDAEWAAMEVERLVNTIDEMLDTAMANREPPFRLALQMADFPTADDNLVGHVTLGMAPVLLGAARPKATTKDRLSKYRVEIAPALRIL